MLLECINPASQSLLTVEQAKLHCRVQHSGEDAAFVDLIKAAEDFCRIHTSRVSLSSTWRLTLPCFPEDDAIDLEISPVQSIVSVSYTDTDGDEQELEDYQLEKSIIVPRLWPAVGESWPATEEGNRNAVVVEFLAGYDDISKVPAQFAQAMKLMVGQWFAYREEIIPGSVTTPPIAAIRLLNQVKSERYV